MLRQNEQLKKGMKKKIQKERKDRERDDKAGKTQVMNTVVK